MKFKLVEKLILYNANNSNRSVGDCVLRSLSLITNISYVNIRKIAIEVAKFESKKQGQVITYAECWKEIINDLDINWNLNSPKYRTKSAEEKQLFKHIAELTDNKSFSFATEYIDEPISIRQFASENNQGRYIVLTKDHAVAVINEDIYDSWDSSKEIIEGVFKLENIVNVDTGKISADSDDLSAFNNKINIEKYKPFIEEQTKNRLNNFIAKSKGLIINGFSSIDVVDNTTIRLVITYDCADNKEIHKTSYIKLNYSLGGNNAIKEACLTQLNKKLSEQFYEVRKQLANE